MAGQIFDIVILNGRPAAGKSEVIDYLKSISTEERIRRFHIGEFEEFDDFPVLWERFEDDDLFEAMGSPRLISDRHFEYEGQRYEGYTFKDLAFWHFLIRKLCHQYERRLRDEPDFHQTHTAVFEFARGTQHGGFTEAYNHLTDLVASRANTIYIKVSWEESLRKNRRRCNPDKPDSILEHSLEDTKMEFLYKESDWDRFSGAGAGADTGADAGADAGAGARADAGADAGYLISGDHRIPFAVFENEPEKTDKPEALSAHLEEVCAALWRRRQLLEGARA